VTQRQRCECVDFTVCVFVRNHHLFAQSHYGSHVGTKNCSHTVKHKTLGIKLGAVLTVSGQHTREPAYFLISLLPIFVHKRGDQFNMD